jgi:hypothetical protein
MTDGSERYHAKRDAGISDIRKDGSRTSAQTDRQAYEAEKFAADAFQQKFNSEIYDTHGDGGSDFTFHGMTVEVIHLGMDGAGPRLTGNLIVNPHEPQRWANIYVVVRGSIETAFDLVGWYVHDDLIELPKRNFRFGDRFCCHVDDLRKMNELFEFDYS